MGRKEAAVACRRYCIGVLLEGLGWFGTSPFDLWHLAQKCIILHPSPIGGGRSRPIFPAWTDDSWLEFVALMGIFQAYLTASLSVCCARALY